MGRLASTLIVASLLLAVPVGAQVPRMEPPTGQREFKSLDGTLLVRVDYDKKTFSLRDAKSDRERWRQTVDRGLDTTPIVDDSGWVALTDGTTFFTILKDKDGSTVGTVRVLDQFTDKEKDRHVQPVTDRPLLWEACSLWGFRAVGGTTYFTVRPWWGRRIIYDCEHGSIVPDEGPLHDQLDLIDRARILKRLAPAAAEPPPRDGDPADWSRVSRARTLALVAGSLRIKEAVEFLRVLEKWEYNNTQSGWSLGEHEESTPPTPLAWSQNTLRQVVQLSLRRLGETPAALPVYRFYFNRNDPYAPPKPEGSRADRTKKIKAGMSAREVLDTLGAPDLITRDPGVWIDRWEYDIDGPEPFTYLVSWKGIRVDNAAESRPPKWKNSADRDGRILN